MQRQHHNSLTRPPLPPLPKGGRNARCAVRREAFTLVEMLVVIMIIALLAGLILPALNRARITANEAKVIGEIKGLESALAAFRAKYGCDPPSSFSLYLTQAGWSNDPTNMAIVRQIWPQFDFTMAAGNNNIVAFPSWWSNNNQTVLNMNSGECLLFFLGGIIETQGQNQVPGGFAKNPAYPFSPPSKSANREGPFFEFTDVGRIKDINNNGINEWYDALPGQTKPYLYFSSYEGRGYNLNELPSDGNTNYTIVGFASLHDVYRVYSSTITASQYPPSSRSIDANKNVVASVSQLLPAQKPQGCQIISPGYDGEYGSGGVFNPNLPNSGLTDSNGQPDLNAYDNLTNFNAGRLKP